MPSNIASIAAYSSGSAVTIPTVTRFASASSRAFVTGRGYTCSSDE